MNECKHHTLLIFKCCTHWLFTAGTVHSNSFCSRLKLHYSLDQFSVALKQSLPVERSFLYKSVILMDQLFVHWPNIHPSISSNQAMLICVSLSKSAGLKLNHLSLEDLTQRNSSQHTTHCLKAPWGIQRLTARSSTTVSAKPTTYMATATALAKANIRPMEPPNSGPRLLEIK